MRQKQVKAKIARQVIIPKELKDFFVYTNSLIEIGDNAATSSSDDLIQGHRAYGGLVEEQSDQFNFTFFTSPHTRPRWHIDTTASRISEIASGKITMLNLWECKNPKCDDLFPSSEDVCMYCDYIDDNRDTRDKVTPLLAHSPSRQEWVRGYLKHFPNDHPMLIIGQYNSQPNLGERLGWFTIEEIEHIIVEAPR